MLMFLSIAGFCAFFWLLFFAYQFITPTLFGESYAAAKKRRLAGIRSNSRDISDNHYEFDCNLVYITHAVLATFGGIRIVIQSAPWQYSLDQLLQWMMYDQNPRPEWQMWLFMTVGYLVWDTQAGFLVRGSDLNAAEWAHHIVSIASFLGGTFYKYNTFLQGAFMIDEVR